MTREEYKAAIEAILFASGSSVPVTRLAQTLEITEKKAADLADELCTEFEESNHGVTVIKLEKSYQMVSKKAYAPQIRTAMDLRRNVPLSQAALEVLAVVAYNQPVTKSFIEQVRGVDCSGVIGSLTTKDLIEEKGRLELPGRPLCTAQPKTSSDVSQFHLWTNSLNFRKSRQILTKTLLIKTTHSFRFLKAKMQKMLTLKRIMMKQSPLLSVRLSSRQLLNN